MRVRVCVWCAVCTFEHAILLGSPGNNTESRYIVTCCTHTHTVVAVAYIKYPWSAWFIDFYGCFRSHYSWLPKFESLLDIELIGIDFPKPRHSIVVHSMPPRRRCSIWHASSIEDISHSWNHTFSPPLHPPYQRHRRRHSLWFSISVPLASLSYTQCLSSHHINSLCHTMPDSFPSLVYSRISIARWCRS